MIELVKSPLTRVLSKGCLTLWLVVSLVFAALLFAAGAQAGSTNAPGGTAETPIGEAATESGAPPEQAAPATEEAMPISEEAPPATQETPPATEETPTATQETPTATEEAPPATQETPPATEETPTATEEAPPATQETPSAAPPATEPPPTAANPPAAEKVPSVAEEAPTAVEKKTVEQTIGEVVAEAGSEATQGMGEDSQVPVGTSGLTHKDATGEVAPGVSPSIAPVAPSEISTVQDQVSLPLRPRKISARCSGRVSCELAEIGASITAGYACGWLDISAVSSVSTILATIDSSPTAITAVAHSGSQDGGSAVENHPSAPIPGSGSGGAGGGSAAAGGSGSTSSAASTLVGVLLQAAPRAMRRLRLAQLSWRTSFFVLIPERPG